MKKLVAFLLALVMSLSLGVTAFAGSTTNHVITVNNESANQHTYEAYQVFAGDYVDGKLSNITWGTGVKGDELLEALQEQEAFENCKSAEAVAEILAGFSTTQAEAFADVVGAHLNTVAGTSSATAATKGFTYTISVTGDGYYFLKDKDGTVTDEGDSYTDFILQVVGNVTVNAKSDTVQVDKKVATGGYACGKTEGVDGHVHSIEACGLAYAEDNKAAIGDVVSFKLESTVPAAAAKFDYYYFIFGDTLSKGLSFVKDTANMVVTIDGAVAVEGRDYTVKTGYEGYTFAVALVDAKANAGKNVVVTYEAKVNEDAVIGVGGNTNTVVVDYSKNPNEKYDGKTEGGFPAEGGKKPDGKTPDKKTKTYVTALKILKVDAKDNTKTLEGATFTITGTTESVVVRTEDVFTKATNGTYYLLKDGSYTTDEPVVEHMESQKDRKNGGYVLCEATDPDIKYTLDGKYYRKATDTEIADNTVALYVHFPSTEPLYVSTSDKYTKTTNTTYKCTPETYSFHGTTDDKGIIEATGLNAGEYTITEIIAPEGYNLLKDPINVKITCGLPEAIIKGDETCTWTYKDGNNTVGEVQSDGTVVITIQNNSGAVLPETGGIGTTLFYVIGAILVVGAGILLITKKRMNARS